MQSIKTTLRKYKKLENRYRAFLDPGMPVAIRVDGKDVTKNHARYPLIPYEGFRRAVFESAVHVAKIFSGTSASDTIVYAALDEATIIFTDAQAFWATFDDRNAMYAASIILQHFLAAYRERSGGDPAMFGISAFSIPKEQVEEYLCLRQNLVRMIGITYIAKEHGMKELYQCNDPEEAQRRCLADAVFVGHMEAIMYSHPDFLTGRMARIPEDPGGIIL